MFRSCCGHRDRAPSPSETQPVNIPLVPRSTDSSSSPRISERGLEFEFVNENIYRLRVTVSPGSAFGNINYVKIMLVSYVEGIFQSGAGTDLKVEQEDSFHLVINGQFAHSLKMIKDRKLISDEGLFKLISYAGCHFIQDLFRVIEPSSRAEVGRRLHAIVDGHGSPVADYISPQITML